ncbi:MAG: septum formation initiator family protein [Methylococcales bacterium]
MSKFIIPFFIIMLLGLQYRMWVGDGGLMTIHNYHQQITELTSKAEKIELQNQQMNLQITQLRTTIDAVESLARRDLGMIVKGEEFFLFNQQQ